jgi:hypothetical protein
MDIEVIGRKEYVDCVGRVQDVWPIRAAAEEGNIYSTVLQRRADVLRLFRWCTTKWHLTISMYCQYIFLFK